jgi:hypothetical protein
MLVVKPNPRRMRFMRNSDSREDLPEDFRPAPPPLRSRIRWEQVAVAAVLGGAVVLGLVVLAAHA